MSRSLCIAACALPVCLSQRAYGFKFGKKLTENPPPVLVIIHPQSLVNMECVTKEYPPRLVSEHAMVKAGIYTVSRPAQDGDTARWYAAHPDADFRKLAVAPQIVDREDLSMADAAAIAAAQAGSDHESTPEKGSAPRRLQPSRGAKRRQARVPSVHSSDSDYELPSARDDDGEDDDVVDEDDLERDM